MPHLAPAGRLVRPHAGPPAFRSLDGSGNNPDHPDWGKAGVPLRREAPPAYADGVAAPAGPDRPSARVVSNAVMVQDRLVRDPRGLTDMVWAWGQFLDHDLDLTPTGSEPLPIPVPPGDPQFDPQGTGAKTLPFRRSAPAEGSAVREQVNLATSWIDASMVYGSDPLRAAALRTFEGGRLKVGEGDLLPFNREGLPNDNPTGLPPETLFLAGDPRANEQLSLASLHTLFVREHNRLCAELAAEHPEWSDETLYSWARKIVAAEIGVITFREFLPALLGPEAPGPYGGYRPDQDATIGNAFATAGYRLGHSQVSEWILRLGEDGRSMDRPPLRVKDSFFRPDRLVAEGGVDPILRGLARGIQEATDPRVVDDLRNFLFGPPGAGGLDLAALNIQRGRDHGLPDYNSLRAAFGLPRRESFAEITRDADRAAKLEGLYGSPDRLDPWVGMLSEDPLPGAAVGATLATVLRDQFTRLRDGDRFWFENDPTLDAEALRQVTLAGLIERNSGVRGLQEHVFFRR